MFIKRFCHSIVRLNYIKSGIFYWEGQQTHVVEALTISVGVILTGGVTI